MSTPDRTTMKAMIRRRYGSPDVLQLANVDKPVVDDDSVLVRVRAASVNAYDWHVIRGLPYLIRMFEGLRRPQSSETGLDLAGEVEAVGKNVTGLRPGDEVFGERSGAFAEYVSAKAENIALKPANLTFEQAAAVPMAGFTAVQALRDKGQLQPGQRVLINGAAGGVGTFAVQIAKVLGAEVTGVCSTGHVEMVRSIGADHVIDYTREDFTRTRERYDLILDIAANRSLASCRRVLTPDGALVMIGAPKGRWFAMVARMLAAIVRSRLGGPRLLPFMAKRRQEDLVYLTGLIEAGKITPVIDRIYPLAETADAVRHVETGHAKGKVVITVSGSTPVGSSP